MLNHEIFFPPETFDDEVAGTYIAHLLQNNQEPSQPEIVQIHELIKQAELKGSRLEAELRRINARIQKYKGLLAPDRRLPADVVAEIFLECLGDGQLSYTFPAARGVTTSLLLAHICSAWRAVAFSTARMWLSLHLDVYRLSVESACALAKHWFSRSGEALPLSLTCCGPSTYTPILEIVKAYASRWEKLSLDTSISSLRSISQTPIKLFSLLDTLTLRFDAETPVSSVTIFGNASSLRRVILPATEPREASFETWKAPIIFPWHQLTHYESGHPSNSFESLQHLSLCPNLIECRMTVVGSMWPEVIILPVALPQLRLLHLRGPGDMSSFFANLCLPVLSEFKFKWLMVGWPSWPAEFSQMIRQSGCSIERFSVQNIFARPDVFIEALHMMPELRELELIQEPDWTYHTLHRYLDEDGVSSLTDRGQSTDELLVPKLQSLKMDGDFLLESSRLVDLVQSRWDIRQDGGSPTKHSAQLKAVQIPIRNSEFGGSLTLRLGQMHMEGLDVKIMRYDAVKMSSVEFT
jgi:hypothetical protein